jgi:cytochrome c-type biogenesis protein CcmE
MKLKHQRLLFIILALALLAAAAALAMKNFREEIVFYYTPSELRARPVAAAFRLGGLVKPGSLTHGESGEVRFLVTDGAAEIPVHYQGALPSLFREGQGVVAEGAMRDDAFTATRILAKHDENYMPPEVARLLKEQGHWNPAPPDAADAP